MKLGRKLIFQLNAACGVTNLKIITPENAVKLQSLKFAQNVLTKAIYGMSVEKELKMH